MDRNTEIPRLTSASAPWLDDPSARAVCAAIAAGGHEVLYVGGCVRNALLGQPVSDVDIATAATPDQVIALVEAAKLKAVPTGLDHGTVTVVSGGTGFEVTTFRRDVATNGRHATVAFSTDLHDDARRRDFTMNALYADPDGVVVDPLGGLGDLRARRVRFIEDADRRIREDYLRTLRYFRFHAWYGDDDEGLDPDALAAIGSNLSGLETLSAERTGAEVRKLLSAPDPSVAMAGMQQTGVLPVILPGADIKLLLLVIAAEAHLGLLPDALGRLFALGATDAADRLRLSRAEARKLDRIASVVESGMPLLETAYRHGEDVALQSYLFACALSETLPDPTIPPRISAAAGQVFPVSAQDLMPAFTGPALGAELARLEALWIASDFTLTRKELLDL
ncbi:CCA tRNA nucleotidyltransferase [Sulfitobacter sp. HNIBRBA3233]|uniref:CCA tRNA nucleotidyltransferase n=1 Tax=Sulfitobacter marinivivus TaxID=3158558 RepID=UPI0032DF438E